nr:o-methyltransferase tpca [Quercus suber]
MKKATQTETKTRHDWSDDYCVDILTGIRMSMSASSRLLIADQVMNTTLGSAELEPAPAPLPANYGYHTRYSHQRDLAMMAIINGIERTPSQFKTILNKAGLEIRKIWSCRSQDLPLSAKATSDHSVKHLA